MPAIRNPSLLKRFTDFLRLKTGDMLDGQVTGLIVPVINIPVDNREIKSESATASDALSATIFTTNAERDTYLIGFDLSIAKSALAPSTNSQIQATPFGEALKAIARINYEPLTAGDHRGNVMLPVPMKLARNSTIAVLNTSATASIDATAIIYFYEEQLF